MTEGCLQCEGQEEQKQQLVGMESGDLVHPWCSTFTMAGIGMTSGITLGKQLVAPG